jgi:hypothetical protein
VLAKCHDGTVYNRIKPHSFKFCYHRKRLACYAVGWVDIRTRTEVPLRFVVYLAKVSKIDEKMFWPSDRFIVGNDFFLGHTLYNGPKFFIFSTIFLYSVITCLGAFVTMVSFYVCQTMKRLLGQTIFFCHFRYFCKVCNKSQGYLFDNVKKLKINPPT